jgi:hypothetical protein
LREVVGNPYRPVTLPLTAYRIVERKDTRRIPPGARPMVPVSPTGKVKMRERYCPWLTPTVLALAAAAYGDRVVADCPTCAGEGDGFPGGPCPRCGGTGEVETGRPFDASVLPVLADALEDAGCTDQALLGHLRRPGPHARGCWAISLILGLD